MTPEEITSIISTLTELLGPSFEHLYRLAVRQSMTYAVFDLVIGLVIVLAVAFGTRAVFRKDEDGDYILDDETIQATFAGIACLFVLVALGLFAFGANRFINPELAALMDLVSMVTP